MRRITGSNFSCDLSKPIRSTNLSQDEEAEMSKLADDDDEEMS